MTDGSEAGEGSLMVRRYFEAARTLLDELEQTQTEAILNISAKLAATVVGGRCVHLLDHGHLLGAEMHNRAGGFPLLSVIGQGDIGNPFLVRRGDAVIIASVSGRAPEVVDAALACKRRGVYVVALSSTAQASAVAPGHPSGKLLLDVADASLDLRGRAGDALVELSGLQRRACPGSGVAGAVLMWALMAQTAERLVSAGMEPTVFSSVNLPDGERAFAEERRRFEDLGY